MTVYLNDMDEGLLLSPTLHPKCFPPPFCPNQIKEAVLCRTDEKNKAKFFINLASLKFGSNETSPQEKL